MDMIVFSKEDAKKILKALGLENKEIYCDICGIQVTEKNLGFIPGGQTEKVFCTNVACHSKYFAEGMRDEY